LDLKNVIEGTEAAWKSKDEIEKKDVSKIEDEKERNNH